MLSGSSIFAFLPLPSTVQMQFFMVPRPKLILGQLKLPTQSDVNDQQNNPSHYSGPYANGWRHLRHEHIRLLVLRTSSLRLQVACDIMVRDSFKRV